MRPAGSAANTPLASSQTSPSAVDPPSGRTHNPGMSYLPRIVDAELMDSLASAGAVLIEGPKACGKTETARQAARSEVLLDVDQRSRLAAAVDPSLVLDGAEPRLIDEWQREPEIWNHVRRAVDDRGGPGHFILTGSSVPRDDDTRHVGAGRFIRLRMRPMTLSEAGRSAGTVSLAAVLAGDPVRATDPGLTVRQIADLVCVGGWPGALGMTVPQAQRLLRGYVTEVARVEVQRVDGVRRDPEAVGRLLRSLARNVATSASINLLRADVNGAEGSLKAETVASYLDALARLMVTENLPAWAPSLRSRTRLRAAAVRHFVDPSLAVAAARATPERLLGDLRWLGLLFENLAVRDLRVHAQALGAQVFAYRDETGLEADAIIEMPDGRWAAFEVKLGLGEVDLAAEHLLRLRGRVDAAAAGEPLALAVITATGYGYVREDGVAVIPIGALTA
jgi:uncharacterized protein